jgi:sec-independent protein translocase protein TatA
MQPMFGFITPTEAVVVLVIALIIFGPGKLPELGKSLGKGIKEFKSVTSDDQQTSKDETKTEDKG